MRKHIKVVGVTAYPPTEYNHWGPSALPHSLIKNRPDDIDFTLYTFLPAKDIEISTLTNQLHKAGIKNAILLEHWGVKSKSRLKNLVRKKIFKFTFPLRKKIHSSYASYPVLKSVINEIKDENPDLIFLYPCNLVNWAKKLSRSFKVVACGPDCYALTLKRKLSVETGLGSITQRDRIELKKRESINKKWHSTQSHMKLVGMDDLESFNSYSNNLNLIKCTASFFKHPLNGNFQNSIDRQKISSPKKILIYGSGNLSEQNLISEITKIISEEKFSNSSSLLVKGENKIEIIKAAKHAGITAEEAPWYDCYEDLLDKVDIQIFPILIGAGTKAKVLSALARGVICIGTKIAFENIALDHRESAYFFEDAKQFKEAFQEICSSPNTSLQVAKEGQKIALSQHDPVKISKQFWESIS
ncbi:MAG: hypothetical protein MI748_12715 [Opitutales bacterium]|nr:hypothetical protein [Opitutales bacterium]